jgi:hypothetical protein
MPEHQFPMGHVVITTHAKDVLSQSDIDACLTRHSRGDWGELCDEDRRQNDLAIAQGMRLFSAYDAPSDGTRFWIITEADRSATTILLPDDY